MVKVAIKDYDGSYTVVLASNSETPYQILTHKHIDPETKKVFINGKKITEAKINTPLSALSSAGAMIYLSVKI